jgi:hypothetical protein
VDHKASTDLKAAPAVTKADDGYGKYDGPPSNSNPLSSATGTNGPTGAVSGLPVPALV